MRNPRGVLPGPQVSKSQPEEKPEETSAVDTPGGGGKEKRNKPVQQSANSTLLLPASTPAACRRPLRSLPHRASASSVTCSVPQSNTHLPTRTQTQRGPTRPPGGSFWPDTDAGLLTQKVTAPPHLAQSRAPCGILGDFYQTKPFTLQTRPPPQKGIQVHVSLRELRADHRAGGPSLGVWGPCKCPTMHPP